LALLCCVLLAYHYSLYALLQNLTFQTPVAYVVLVPPIALALALLVLSQDRGRPVAQDRELDLIIGLPLIGVALLILLVLPIQLSLYYWVYRMDLLSLPVFVAGAVTLLFGVQMLWRLALPIAFLALTWPAPYFPLLDSFGNGMAQLTSAAVRVLTSLPGTDAVQASGLELLQVRGPAGSFVVDITAACGGVNGLLGFGLLSVAVLLLTDGRWPRKLLWFALGVAVVFVANLLRILAVMAIGYAFGEAAAIQRAHPLAGLVGFNLALLFSLWLVQRCGLRWRHIDVRWAARRPRGSRALLALVGLLLALSATMAFADAGLADYRPVISSSTELTRMSDFARVQPQPAGWKMRYVSSQGWAPLYFGGGALWIRYQYSGPHGLAAFADVVDTPDRGALATYGVENCYLYHQWQIEYLQRLDLGHGVSGVLLDYYNPDLHASWSTVYWEWPVLRDSSLVYERVVLIVTPRDIQAPQPHVTSTNFIRQSVFNLYAAVSGYIEGPQTARFQQTNRLLEGLAVHVVDSMARSASGG
jgi:exosortase/archaeosortase family protein